MFLIIKNVLNASRHSDAKIKGLRCVTIALSRLIDAKALEPTPRKIVLFMEVIIE